MLARGLKHEGWKSTQNGQILGDNKLMTLINMLKFIHRFHFYLGIKFKLVPFPSSGKMNESYVLGSTKST